VVATPRRLDLDPKGSGRAVNGARASCRGAGTRAEGVGGRPFAALPAGTQRRSGPGIFGLAL